MPDAYLFLELPQTPHDIPKTVEESYTEGQRSEFKIPTFNEVVNRIFDFSFLIKYCLETPFHQYI